MATEPGWLPGERLRLPRNGFGPIGAVRRKNCQAFSFRFRQVRCIVARGVDVVTSVGRSCLFYDVNTGQVCSDQWSDVC